MNASINKPAPRILWILLGYKAAYIVLILVCLRLFPDFNESMYRGGLHWPREGGPTFESRFTSWDGAHYLKLVQEGYRAGSSSCAFYPLWPLLIRIFSILTLGNPMWAGIILAHLLSIAALYFFHSLVLRYHGIHIANLALALMLAFPGAIFFSFIYTESLFLLLISLFFLFLFRKNYLGLAVVGYLLPLTKAIGIFCLAALAWRFFAHRRDWRPWMVAYCMLMGYGSYFLIMWASTGNPFEGFAAQRFYPNQPSISNIINVAGIWNAFCNIGSFHDSRDSILDRGFFVLFLASLYGVWKVKRIYFVYALFAGTIPALSTWFFSYSRNIMMCIPLFIFWAKVFEPKDRRWMLYYYIVVFGGVQIFFLSRYVNFRWAG